MKKICSVGSATQDIFMLYEGADTLHLHSQKKESSFLMLEQGTKIDIPKLHYATGGGSTNAAVCFKRLGLEVEAFFKIGTDHTGQFIEQEMHKESISIKHALIDPNASSAISFIIPSIEHNHVALCFRGSNTKLTEQEFPLALLHDVSNLHISPLSGRSGQLLPYIAEAAKQRGISVSTNPSMGQILHETALFQTALPFIDILIANAYEAAHITTELLKKEHLTSTRQNNTHAEAPKLLTRLITYNGNDITLFEYCKALLQKGPSVVVVTNGSEGVYVATHDVLYFHPSLKADVVCALGAGDAFSAAFVGSLALGKSIEMAILYGVINACSVIQFMDAKEGLLTATQLERQAQLIGTNKLQRFSMK